MRQTPDRQMILRGMGGSITKLFTIIYYLFTMSHILFLYTDSVGYSTNESGILVRHSLKTQKTGLRKILDYEASGIGRSNHP